MTQRQLAGIVLLIGVSTGSATAANAAERANLTVAPGATVVVDSSEKAIVDKSTGVIKGKVTVDQAGTAPANNRLLYRAPSDATDNLAETIQYEKEGTGREATIRVVKSGEAGNQSLASPEAWSILVQMFVIAVLLEQALSVIFNWRPFLANFDARGVKTIVSVLTAWLVVTAFKLDLFKDLVNAYATNKVESDFSTKVLTAFILAGGSGGVNNLLVKLGFRSMRSAEQIAPKPPHKEAWIAVRLVRDQAVGLVAVSIGVEGTTPPVAGMIAGSSGNAGLLRYFLVDRGRFPTVGGYSLTPEDGKQYIVQLDGFDAQRKQLASAKWGPHAIAPGAIIDIEIRL